METPKLLPQLQILIYLLETGALSIVLAVAAVAGEPAIGPVAQLLLATVVPLPCHLLLASHAWAGRALARRSVRVPQLHPLTAPLPA